MASQQMGMGAKMGGEHGGMLPLRRMMAYLTLIINLQAACHRVIQRAKDKNVRSFEKSPGTRKQKDGQRKATVTCKYCPATRFGEESQDDTWTFDLGRASGWKNPIVMRLSTKEFERSCRDHVETKAGSHRFWETVERVDKMSTSGSVSPSQQDRENLAKTKFEQERRVLQKWEIEIRPLPKKRKAPTACAGTPLCICIWLSSYSLPVCVWLHNATSSYTPTLTRLMLHVYSTMEMEELRAQNQRLMALVSAGNADH